MSRCPIARDLLSSSRKLASCTIVATTFCIGVILADCHVDMSDAIVYVDTSDVREGALEELKAAIKELVDFIDANEPRIIAYNVYFTDDGSRILSCTCIPIPHPWNTTWRWRGRSFASSWSSSRCHRSTSTASQREATEAAA